MKARLQLTKKRASFDAIEPQHNMHAIRNNKELGTLIVVT